MQKRAPRQDQVIADTTGIPRPVLPPVEAEQAKEIWRRNLPVGFNSLARIQMFQPSDSYASCKLAFDIANRISDICAKGDWEALRAMIEELRASDEPILNRPTSWEF